MGQPALLLPPQQRFSLLNPLPTLLLADVVRQPLQASHKKCKLLLRCRLPTTARLITCVVGECLHKG